MNRSTAFPIVLYSPSPSVAPIACSVKPVRCRVTFR